MDKLDRSGWAEGFVFVLHGVRIGIRANRLGALDGLATHLPLGWKPSGVAQVHRLYSLIVGGPARPNVRQFHWLYADASRMVRSLDLRDVFVALEYDIEVYVAEHARGRVFVHAGVVELDGRAIVLPGATRDGKTTLVAAFVRAGAVYYSDEYALIDARGRVHPYPRPLSIRSETGDPRATPAEALGGSVGCAPVAVGTILVTRYQPRTVWNPRPLSSGQTVLELLANTLSAKYAPRQAMSALACVAESARNLTGARGEADEVVGALLRDE